jgi:hypothetical protein
MNLEAHGTTLPKMGPITVNWAYYRHLLKQEKPENSKITPVAEIDAEISIFTSTIKSAENASKPYHM